MKKFVPVLFLFLSCFGAQVHAQTISWEIVNRFAPFQALDAPADKFRTYRLQEGEDFEAWHRRLDAMQGGVRSPYADALENLRHEQALPWRQVSQTHHPRLLNYIQAENDAATTVRAHLRVDVEGNCTFAGDVIKPCGDGHVIDLPLSGANVTVSTPSGDVTEKLTPEHSVIVALGDSYGAGEGNPDDPARWKSRTGFGGTRTFLWLTNSNRLKGPAEEFGAPRKRWLDDTCHRSFFSHQTLTALRMASEDPHRFVSYFHYACTGAEIFDGVLVPQYQAWGEGVYVKYSQLNFAIRDLCRGTLGSYVAANDTDTGSVDLTVFDRRGGKDNVPKRASDLVPDTDNFARATRWDRRRAGGAYPNSGILACDDLRKPDHLFLSIAGNDVGFGDIVQYYIAPSVFNLGILEDLLYPAVCPDRQFWVDEDIFSALAEHCLEKLDDDDFGYDVGTLIGPGAPGGIANRLELLFNILEARLGIARGDVVIPQYPDPLRTVVPKSDPCGPVQDGEDAVHGVSAGIYDEVSPWNGLKAEGASQAGPLLLANMKGWQFNMTEADAARALGQIDAFRSELASWAASSGVENFVCAARDAFVGHGWWQGTRQNLPNARGKGLEPWDPATWDPYAYEPEGRAIRTGNDSVMTQPGDKRITGSVHPNLTGHRLVAEIVWNAVFANQ